MKYTTAAVAVAATTAVMVSGVAGVPAGPPMLGAPPPGMMGVRPGVPPMAVTYPGQMRMGVAGKAGHLASVSRQENGGEEGNAAGEDWEEGGAAGGDWEEGGAASMAASTDTRGTEAGQGRGEGELAGTEEEGEEPVVGTGDASSRVLAAAEGISV
ncbi:hypothetical protein MMPV_000592 [Pyropia vietnamensis]